MGQPSDGSNVSVLAYPLFLQISTSTEHRRMILYTAFLLWMTDQI